MKIEVIQKQHTIGKSLATIIKVTNGIGLQGAKGLDGKNGYPDGGNDGELLEKQINGVGWTSQPTNLTLNGGNF